MSNRGNGYSGYSKSNNAISAEEDGKFTVSEISRRTKLTTDTIKHFFEPCEWHHTSKNYNKTDYYDLEEIVSSINEEVLEFDKTQKEKNKTKRSLKGCKVEWIDWQGTGRNKRPIQRSEENCTILISGKKHTITTSTGESFVKMEGANGFSFLTAAQLRERKQQEKELKRQLRQEKAQLNKDLKSLLSDKSKSLVVMSYLPFVRNEKNEINLSTLNFEQPTAMTKKAFKEQLEKSGLSYAQRTVRECAQNGYSRLGKGLFVIHSDNPQAVLTKLEEQYIDETLDYGETFCEVDNRRILERIKDRTDHNALLYKGNQRFSEVEDSYQSTLVDCEEMKVAFNPENQCYEPMPHHYQNVVATVDFYDTYSSKTHTLEIHTKSNESNEYEVSFRVSSDDEDLKILKDVVSDQTLQKVKVEHFESRLEDELAVLKLEAVDKGHYTVRFNHSVNTTDYFDVEILHDGDAYISNFDSKKFDNLDELSRGRTENYSHIYTLAQAQVLKQSREQSVSSEPERKAQPKQQNKSKLRM
ncbi:hypothetical protein ACOLNO_000124 [Vibrio parahaemolyticus]